MEIMHVFVIFVAVFKLTIVAVVGCNDGSTCPADKPYCTSVGCVYRCQEFMYINGTSCVSDCGDGFVHEDNRCVNTCEHNEYVFETVKLTVIGLYKERKCVRNCPRSKDFQRMYILNRTCVDICPLYSKFIYREFCLSDCPSNSTFKTNSTLNSTSYHRCLNKCDVYSENTFCTNECSAGKVIFNSTCVDECPVTHTLSEDRVCVAICNNKTLHTNDSCICPQGKQFIQNNTCVSSCYGKYNKTMLLNGHTHCMDHCSADRYLFNDTCVHICPDKTFLYHNNCLSQCPSNAMFVKIEQKIWMRWPNLSAYTSRAQKVCTEICPDGWFNKYNNNYTCVSKCPKYRFNKTCFAASCPNTTFRLDAHTVGVDCHNGYCDSVENMTFQCLERCPEELFPVNNTCVKYCPTGFYQYNSTCIQQCPAPYKARNTTFHYISHFNKDTTYYHRGWKKVLNYTDGKECTLTCHDYEVIYNNTCQYKCPSSHRYKTNQTCHKEECPKYSYQYPQHILCTNECTNSEFLNFNTCVTACPAKSVIFNGSCLASCPGNRYRYNTNIGIECIDICPSNFMVYNMTCFKKCPSATFYFNNNQCVNKCPEEQPLALHTASLFSSDKRLPKCIRYCEDNRLFQDGQCIYHSDCNTSTMVVFDRQCRKRCPGQYRLVSLLCVHIHYVVIILILTSVFAIVATIYARNTLWNYLKIMYCYFTSSDISRLQAQSKPAAIDTDTFEMEDLDNLEETDFIVSTQL